MTSVESSFIPDEYFARDVQRALTPGTGGTSCTSVSTVRISGGVSDRDRMGALITVWRWEVSGDRPDQRKVSQMARDAVASSHGPRREKLSRLHVEVFKSEHSGVASRTVYQVVPA